jgi:hypothetical protein
MVVYDWHRRISAAELAKELEKFILAVLSPKEEVEEMVLEEIEMPPEEIREEEIIEEELIDAPLPIIANAINVYDIQTQKRRLVEFSFYETGYQFLQRIFPDRDNQQRALYFCPSGSTMCNLVESRSRTMLENGVQPDGQLVVGYIPITGFEKTIDIRPPPTRSPAPQLSPPVRRMPYKIRSPVRMNPRLLRRGTGVASPPPTRKRTMFVPRQRVESSMEFTPIETNLVEQVQPNRITRFQSPTRNSRGSLFRNYSQERSDALSIDEPIATPARNSRGSLFRNYSQVGSDALSIDEPALSATQVSSMNL